LLVVSNRHAEFFCKLISLGVGKAVGRAFVTLEGKVPASRRFSLVDKFQDDPTIRVCLLSLHASSEGINLCSSCHVVHVDIWWNESKMSQASDRVHRIGQTRDVFITQLRVKNTIETEFRVNKNSKLINNLEKYFGDIITIDKSL